MTIRGLRRIALYLLVLGAAVGCSQFKDEDFELLGRMWKEVRCEFYHEEFKFQVFDVLDGKLLVLTAPSEERDEETRLKYWFFGDSTYAADMETQTCSPQIPLAPANVLSSAETINIDY